MRVAAAAPARAAARLAALRRPEAAGRMRGGPPPSIPGSASRPIPPMPPQGAHHRAHGPPLLRRQGRLLSDRLRRRFRALGVADAAAYAALLERSPEDGRDGAGSRDHHRRDLLLPLRPSSSPRSRETILPDLLAARAARASLRIWSAGCSTGTGAEPYSLAILVHELLGRALPDWQVTILGTDISAAALATARAAAYGRWALRTSPPEERMRYFRAVPPQPGAAREGGYALRETYRRMVRFERRNLLELVGGGAPPHLDGFDLILCRNVLIYFEAETVAALMRAFGARLRDRGWLLIGHAEPNPAFAGWLDAVSLPGTVAYRRPGEAPPAEAGPPGQPSRTLAAPDPAGAAAGAAGADPRAGLRADLRTGFRADRPARASPPPAAWTRRGAPARVRGGPSRIPLRTPRRRWPRSGRAPTRARAARPWRALRAALAARPTDPTLRFYEGLIAASLGREAEAERAFRAALYLDPGFVMAHHHLGLLLAGLGRTEAARRALDNALRLSQALPPETVLREGDGGDRRRDRGRRARGAGRHRAMNEGDPRGPGAVRESAGPTPIRTANETAERARALRAARTEALARRGARPGRGRRPPRAYLVCACGAER